MNKYQYKELYNNLKGVSDSDIEHNVLDQWKLSYFR